MPGPQAPFDPRPYRRAVAFALVILSIIIAVTILRGIFGTLLGLSSPPTAGSRVERMELCLRELDQLEADTRAVLSTGFAAPPPQDDATTGRALMRPLEKKLDALVDRCGLKGEPAGPGELALSTAASELRAAIRAGDRLWEQHRSDGLARARAAQASLEEAREALGRAQKDPDPRAR